jgi:hypothetical protein
MVTTGTDDPPPRTCMRCVPRSWVVPSTAKPKLIWDDSGSGGRAGSVWAMNSLGLMAVTQGHSAPTGEEFFDFTTARFFLGDADYQLITSLTRTEP